MPLEIETTCEEGLVGCGCLGGLDGVGKGCHAIVENGIWELNIGKWKMENEKSNVEGSVWVGR